MILFFRLRVRSFSFASTVFHVNNWIRPYLCWSNIENNIAQSHCSDKISARSKHWSLNGKLENSIYGKIKFSFYQLKKAVLSDNFEIHQTFQICHKKSKCVVLQTKCMKISTRFKLIKQKRCVNPDSNKKN